MMRTPGELGAAHREARARARQVGPGCDIGKLVAELLLTGWTGKKIVELGTLRTANQMAAAVGKAIGRDVKAQAVPREAGGKTLEGFGLPPGASGPYEQMMDSINSGWITFGVP